MKTLLTSDPIRHGAACFSSARPLSRERGVFQGRHSIALKTLLCFLSIFALITVLASLDGYRVDGGVLASSFAVAALFALALTEGRGPARPPLSMPRPAFSRTDDREPARSALFAGLARRRGLVTGFGSPESQTMKRAA